MYANRRNFRHLQEIWVEEHDGTSDFWPEVEARPFRACAMKKRNITLLYGRIAEISAS